MIFAATVISPGMTEGAFTVAPQYTRVDGLDAPYIDALAVNGLVPVNGDTVYCAEGINDFAPAMQLLINDNGGAYPLIFASLAPALVYTPDIQFSGDIKLGQGSKKMVLGDSLATWAAAVDAALTALYAWGVTVGPPFPNTPALQPWSSGNLSQKHTLD